MNIGIMNVDNGFMILNNGIIIVNNGVMIFNNGIINVNNGIIGIKDGVKTIRNQVQKGRITIYPPFLVSFDGDYHSLSIRKITFNNSSLRILQEKEDFIAFA